jgi:hypothetical protein
MVQLMQPQLVFAEAEPSALTNFYTRSARSMDSGLVDFYGIFNYSNYSEMVLIRA